MTLHWRRWAWLLMIGPAALGLARLRFDVEVLDLLPRGVPAVQGLKLYQEHFAAARELILSLEAAAPDVATEAARSIAARLRRETNLVAAATWQPPWLEHPEQAAELVAYLWFNQPPKVFAQLVERLAPTRLAAILAATRQELATTLSPGEIARLAYDPFGLTRLPDRVAAAGPGWGRGEDMFASADGTFRLVFIKARGDLRGYRECSAWFQAVKADVAEALRSARPPLDGVTVGFTGRPVFVAETAGSMRRDITVSILGTGALIALLFWLAHRRLKPMFWLLALLALVLVGTLGLGGLLFGTINVLSMGFAAILLGLAVDYAVVHYQEALAHPDLSVPEIRRAIAPSIFWAAITTVAAFLVLNLGGLPGLAQLGSLVGLGIALAAVVMIFAFLPPLFPDRLAPKPHRPRPLPSANAVTPLAPGRARAVWALTAVLVASCLLALSAGLPKLDASTAVFQPRNSQAYTTLKKIQTRLGHQREPLWLIVAGRDEAQVARRLDAIQPVLEEAVGHHLLTEFKLPAALWPRPRFQAANRRTALELAAEGPTLAAAAQAGGFSKAALGLSRDILATWERAAAAPGVFWPTNKLCRWILDRLVARDQNRILTIGFLFPPADSVDTAALARLQAQLGSAGVWLAGWNLLGHAVLAAAKRNLWKLVLPIAGLVLLSLGLAFRRPVEIALSLAILALSGLGLLAIMRLVGWSWNVLNLMAVPLILGTGVDYSLFMQLALRRHHGDLDVAFRSVGRALLLCGGTAMAGFGSLGLSGNPGMAGLGQVCAVGIGGNMLISVFLLPVWWKTLVERSVRPSAARSSMPSSLYGARLWATGVRVARWLPKPLCAFLARLGAALYWRLASHRRRVVRDNLLPVLGPDRQAATAAARRSFRQFALKLVDLWRHESGLAIAHSPTGWQGWESFTAAHARGNGVLLVTPHLGNWELGGAFLAQHGCQLLVISQPEPEPHLTELRRRARARHGIQTRVVGADAFGALEIIRRLQGGATVALLVDRPPPSTGVTVELFGQPFRASPAAAELARASGCAILPAYVVRQSHGYLARILPEIHYDRAALCDRGARTRLIQEIMRAFEPVIRQHVDQWYHFVTIWPNLDRHAKPAPIRDPAPLPSTE